MKRYFVICNNCKHYVHKGKYCEQCGKPLKLQKKQRYFVARYYRTIYFIEDLLILIVVSAITIVLLNLLNQ